LSGVRDAESYWAGFYKKLRKGKSRRKGWSQTNLGGGNQKSNFPRGGASAMVIDRKGGINDTKNRRLCSLKFLLANIEYLGVYRSKGEFVLLLMGSA